jgi:hypothetical protein
MLVGAALAGTIGTAAAAGLFDPATAADIRAAGPVTGTQDRLVRRPSPAILRDRLVRLNANELARIVPSGIDTASDRRERASVLTGAVTLELFPGVSVTANRTRVETPDEGGYAWSGEASGRQAYVTLVIVNNEVMGTVQMNGKLYSIEPITGAVHRIIEINQDLIKDDIHVVPPGSVPQQKSSAPQPSLAAEAEPKVATAIRVLIANTLGARNELPGSTVAQKQQQMEMRITLALTRTNDAFVRSQVNIKFVRVGGRTEVLNYNEAVVYGGLTGGSNDSLVLCDLSDFDCVDNPPANRAKFDAVRTKRDATKADLVILMRRISKYACGIAWVPDPPSLAGPFPTDDQGYAVVASTPASATIAGCIEGDTMAHETGHNMGLHHDRTQHRIDTGTDTNHNGHIDVGELGPIPPASKFNFGHVNKTKKFFTIMAYRTSCGSGCTRAPYYSNPGLTFDAGLGPAPLGVPQGTPGVSGSADTHRTLNITRATISKYRQ